MSPVRIVLFALSICLASSALGQGGPGGPPPFAPLQAPPAPPQNPVTANKANLGKALFWDEHLSSTRTVSCGTCHQPSKGGADPRATLGVAGATNPGPDGIFGNADDVTGSPGVPLNRVDGGYDWSNLFGMNPQVTGRYPPPSINAGYAPNIFWDGRGTSAFSDPLTGTVLIPGGGALESQAAGPPLSDAEMAHQNRDWTQAAAQIAVARPLGLATGVPTALTTYVNGRSYPELFVEAFGLSEAATPSVVTPARIAMAIATYERTQFSDQTPLDLGQALTPQEINGRNIFNGPGRCNRCHGGNRFTDDNFHYIGVRPQNEDPGRFAVTGNANDLGRFKTPGLRNVSLRGPFMHNGRFATLMDVVQFYNRGGDFDAPNKNPNIRPLGLSAQQLSDLVAFMTRPMTDPRVGAEQAPFDRPQLFAGSSREPATTGTGTAGTGGITPQVVAIEPPAAGNPNFTVGVFDGLGGAVATLVIDESLPAAGALPDLSTVDYSYSTTLTAGGNGEGRGSVSVPIADRAALAGTRLFGRWYVTDAGGGGGYASSPAIDFTLFGPHFGNGVALSGVEASDGTSSDQVDLQWDPALGASLYRIFRHTSSDFASASQIGTASTASFADTSAVAGVSYSYWVTVDGDEGQTVEGDSDGGSRASAPEIALELTGSAALTDGSSLIDWGSVAPGSTARLQFTIRNDGTADLSGISVVLDGSDVADFSLVAAPAVALGPGLSTSFEVDFTPSQIGTRLAALHVSSNDGDENPFDVSLQGEGVTAANQFSVAAGDAGLSGTDAEAESSPHQDGVANLAKYAFNMDLSQGDSTMHERGTGTGGLPCIEREENGGAGIFRYEYVRRVGSGLTYTPKKSTSLDSASWIPLTDTPEIQAIDAQWERVIYEEPYDLASTPRCFGRVDVTLP